MPNIQENYTQSQLDIISPDGLTDAAFAPGSCNDDTSTNETQCIGVYFDVFFSKLLSRFCRMLLRKS